METEEETLTDHTPHDGWGVLWFVWFAMGIISFSVLEYLAIRFNKPTLSHMIVDIFFVWPPIAVLLGLAFGALAAHWFWR